MSNLDTKIQDIWKEDKLSRKNDAKFLITFLRNRLSERQKSGQKKSYVLNIDAGWGRGKSFFMKRLTEHLIAEDYLVVSVNAWKDDHAEDPLLAVMSAADSELTKHLPDDQFAKQQLQRMKRDTARVLTAISKGAFRHWLHKAIGDGADAVEEFLNLEVEENENSMIDASGKSGANEIIKVLNSKTDSLFSQFRKSQQAIENFKGQMEKTIQLISSGNKKTPLFILIDELDRCRPIYAIQLLERVKHIFEIDDVVFIVATDTDQLQHSINAIYGNGFDSQRYLKRFFDRTYLFEPPEIDKYVDLLCETLSESDEVLRIPLENDEGLATFLADCFTGLDLSLRDVEQCMDILRSVVTVWPYGHLPIQMSVLVPIVVTFQQLGLRNSLREIYEDFLTLVQKSKRKMDFRSYSMHHQHGQAPERVNIANIFKYFVSAGAKNLPELTSEQLGSAWADWVRRQYSEEYHTLYGGGSIVGNEPSSVVKQYPEFVRSAGRLMSNIDGQE
ncbi:KAP family P-loop NTPase fold protein [Roseibium marinum]|uniref:KAP-like P-loop domain-containing protein n=1 Tax=Roseibium marinum TaxID=281252 RepID=A0A2S3UYF4_9HYPH|nr:P-loop NTPase fold protein [Roseibium marinum]POF32755.1 KAP-like P-loop domain-containing protein [Roseibium marinum]